MSQESKQKLNKLNTRTSWSGSTQNVNYRVSTWPALAGVSKGKPGKQNTRLLANDEDHIAGLATQTHITAPPDMNIPQLFENILIPPGIHLWSLSLIGSHTKLTTQTLQPLSNIACLGFLDLSETDVSLQTLQTCLRPVQIMRLHLFHCPNILSTVTTATIGENRSQFHKCFHVEFGFESRSAGFASNHRDICRRVIDRGGASCNHKRAFERVFGLFNAKRLGS
ncbi:hypothetical protein BDR26DRAFT_898092 [Obelidium mucronatum]|nr:hypothetical protein BDR26DRAFT_898092 [Obelidium mucronatum]